MPDDTRQWNVGSLKEFFSIVDSFIKLLPAWGNWKKEYDSRVEELKALMREDYNLSHKDSECLVGEEFNLPEYYVFSKKVTVQKEWISSWLHQYAPVKAKDYS